MRARHSALFVALVDLAFVGTFIAAVYELRGITDESCSNFTAGGFYLSLGPFGYYGRQSDSPWSLHINKTCAMLKASFAFGIMNCIFFFITFVSGFSNTAPQKKKLDGHGKTDITPYSCWLCSSTTTTETTIAWLSSASTTHHVTPRDVRAVARTTTDAPHPGARITALDTTTSSACIIRGADVWRMIRSILF